MCDIGFNRQYTSEMYVFDLTGKAPAGRQVLPVNLLSRVFFCKASISGKYIVIKLICNEEHWCSIPLWSCLTVVHHKQIAAKEMFLFCLSMNLWSRLLNTYEWFEITAPTTTIKEPPPPPHPFLQPQAKGTPWWVKREANSVLGLN